MTARSLAPRLGELAELVGLMCITTATAMQHATAALVDGRDRLAAKVVADEAQTDELRERIETLASEALLLHTPVAGDLRTVVATIRCVGDVDRMAKLTQHVARVAQRHAPGTAVPREVAPTFREMGRCAVALGIKAAEVARTRNVLLAVELDTDDDLMDALHQQMFGVMMHPSWPYGVATAVDVTLLARYYERFADHAVKIARQTVYAVTGQKPESLPV